MTIRGFRQGSMARLAAVVTAALIAAGTPAAWAGPATSAKPATALEVQSDPAGAAVYVDGQLKGATPIAVEGIGSGDHTVRVVKEGFLENSRTVSVPAAGRSLRVALTPTRVPPLAATMMQVEPEAEGGGGGGGKKWLFIGLGAVALTGVGVGVYLATKNDPPEINSVSASPTTALMGATQVSFSASASDDDALTYSWNFGDGGSGSGASTTHVYQSAGTFNVTVTVSDGKKDSTGSTAVTVKSMAGRWSGRLTGSSPINFNLAQTGAALAGTYQAVYPGNRAVSGAVTGSVSAPNRVMMTVRVPGFYVLYYDAPLDSSLDSMSGTVTENNVPFPFNLSRE